MQNMNGNAGSNREIADTAKSRRTYTPPAVHSQRGVLQALVQSGCTEGSCPDTVACPTAGATDPC